MPPLLIFVGLRMLNKVAIVGSGSWGTALVKIFTDSGIPVSWTVRNAESANYIKNNGHNPRYLSFASINMGFTEVGVDVEAAIAGADLTVFAVPSAYLKDTLQKVNTDTLKSKLVAVSIKGLVPGSGFTPATIIAKHLGVRPGSIVVLGGPCHAEDVANRKTTYMTISSEDISIATALCSRIRNHYIRTVPNDDPAGLEYTAILKNIIGIAGGIAHGLHYGDNFQAVLVSNAMREVVSFIDAIEPRRRDTFSSAYFGDLLVTAYSDNSRNRTLGKLIGRGLMVNEALQAMEMIAEGFIASRELQPALKKMKVSLPVINSVYRILHQHANPYHEFKLLEEHLY